jgi:FtsH-binding integral membrane protein
MARERPRVPLEEMVQPYREAREEVEERYMFTWFFGFLAIILILIGAGLIVNALTQYFPPTEATVNGVKVLKGGLRFEFFGFVGACMGLIVLGLTLFDVYWNDRYLVFTIGLLMAVGFSVWGILTSTELPDIVKGGVFMFMALVIVGIVSAINIFGWVRLKAHKYSAFMLLILLNLVFLVIVAAVSIGTH